MKHLLLTMISEMNANTEANPEYLRGQVELARELLGYADDGAGEDLYQELTQAANVNPY